MADIVTLDRPLDVFAEQAPPATRVRGYWQSVFYRLRHDPVTLVFGAVVLAIVLAALSAPLIAPFDPYKESIIGRLKPFGWGGHLLGTDELGRDMLSRLLYGEDPRHPYTRALLASRPSMDPERRIEEPPITGDPPNPIDPPPGCRFHTRCPFAEAVCEATDPTLELWQGPESHIASCHMRDPGSGHSQAGNA
jgi:oligopeptide/dipeptide ABC transporter ATP-binding protein